MPFIMFALSSLARTLRVTTLSAQNQHALPIQSARHMSVAVSTVMVKALREASGAPMMDCKKALGECNGSVDAAIDWLRAKGIARAAKNADRVAQEGLVAVLNSQKGTTLVEINTETDFVSKNAGFHQFVSLVAKSAAAYDPAGEGTTVSLLPNGASATSIAPDALLAANGGTVQNALGLVIASIRENIVIKRVLNLAPAPAASNPADLTVFSSYVHGRVKYDAATAEGLAAELVMGKVASVVCLHAPGGATTTAGEAVEEHGRRLAMHVVAAKPLFCSEADLTEAFLSRELAIMDEQMAADEKNAAKPAQILVRIREGKINKRLSEVCLASQPHVVEEGSHAVHKVLQAAGKGLGLAGDLEVTYFQRWGLGEESN